MGAKKKTEITQPPPAMHQEKSANAVIVLRSADAAEFKTSEELLLRYSTKMRSLIDESLKKDTVNLSQFDREIVQCLVEFLNLHKQKEPTKIAVPIKTNQNLKFIMEQSDAQYIDKIMAKGDGFVFQMLQISTYVEIEHLRKRLACGVALKLMKSTLEELKEDYQVEDDFGEDELRGQMRSKLQLLKYNEEQQ